MEPQNSNNAFQSVMDLFKLTPVVAKKKSTKVIHQGDRVRVINDIRYKGYIGTVASSAMDRVFVHLDAIPNGPFNIEHSNLILEVDPA